MHAVHSAGSAGCWVGGGSEFEVVVNHEAEPDEREAYRYCVSSMTYRNLPWVREAVTSCVLHHPGTLLIYGYFLYNYRAWRPPSDTGGIPNRFL
jgi:hypothetical protein